MPDLWRTPDAQISQRPAAFSLASEALKPATKRRTALGLPATELETGRRLTYLPFVRRIGAHFFPKGMLISLPAGVKGREQGLTTTTREVRLSHGGVYFNLCVLLFAWSCVQCLSRCDPVQPVALLAPSSSISCPTARGGCVREAHSPLHAHCTCAELPWLILNALVCMEPLSWLLVLAWPQKLRLVLLERSKRQWSLRDLMT